MTGISADDTRLLVLFGEMRGDLKSLLRSQEELSERLAKTENATDEQLESLSNRVKSLEALRLKVAGFATAAGVFATVIGHKAEPVIAKLIGTLGG